MIKMNFYIDQKPYHKHLDLFVSREIGSRFWAAKPMEFVEIPEDTIAPSNPAIPLTPTDAQALMDELYRAGVRPTRMESSAGALGATERHLKDMQSIAFGLLGTNTREKAE